MQLKDEQERLRWLDRQEVVGCAIYLWSALGKTFEAPVRARAGGTV